MLVTFGATFSGVIASFLLWFGGQWGIKRLNERRAVKHITREIHEEIALNINTLIWFTEDVSKIIAGGNIPLFLPHRLNLSVYQYLTSSGELRLLNINKQRWILNAGMHSERFNKFIDNTELLLASLMGLPNSLEISKQRLDNLVKQANESAKRLKEMLREVDMPKAKQSDFCLLFALHCCRGKVGVELRQPRGEKRTYKRKESHSSYCPEDLPKRWLPQALVFSL